MNPWMALALIRTAAGMLRELRQTGDSWKVILESFEYLPARVGIQALLKGIDDDALRKAITALAERQAELLAGRGREELPTSELNAYMALGGLKQILEARRVRIQLDADFATWLIDQALPALDRAAPFSPGLSRKGE